MADLTLFPGTPVVIERIGPIRYTEEKFHGRIQVVDVSRLVVILPAGLAQVLPLDPGDEVQLKASLPEGMFRFSGRVLERGERGFTVPYPFAVTGLQRRQQRRIPAEGIAIFAVRDTATARPNFATLVDISIGGLQFQAEKWTPVGANVDIEFSLREGLRGTAQGVIVWKKDVPLDSAALRAYCYGLRFAEIDERVRQHIVDHIREHDRLQLAIMAAASPTP